MNFFSYESKVMQTIMVIGDYIILNLMFLLFCIPVFTVGAAQAGLYTGMRVLLNKEDDSSCTAAFWRGFKNGFGTITVTWCIFLAAIGGLVWCFVQLWGFQAMGQAGAPLAIGLSVTGLALLAILQSLASAFHSRFGCTWWQLFRNAWFLFISFPIRSIVVGVLTWGPVLVMCFNFYLFMQASPIFLAGYYSLAFMANCLLLRKPFSLALEAYSEAGGTAAEEPGQAEADSEEPCEVK